MDYLQSNDARQVVTPEQMTNGIVDAFKEKSVMDEYLEAMKMNGINVDDAEVKSPSTPPSEEVSTTKS